MTNIVGLGRHHRQQALQHMSKVANMEQQRDMANEGIKFQEKQAKISNTLTGAVGGAMIGAQMGGAMGGPIGAVGGAAIGYLATELF